MSGAAWLAMAPEIGVPALCDHVFCAETRHGEGGGRVEKIVVVPGELVRVGEDIDGAEVVVVRDHMLEVGEGLVAFADGGTTALDGIAVVGRGAVGAVGMDGERGVVVAEGGVRPGGEGVGGVGEDERQRGVGRVDVGVGRALGIRVGHRGIVDFGVGWAVGRVVVLCTPAVSACSGCGF